MKFQCSKCGSSHKVKHHRKYAQKKEEVHANYQIEHLIWIDQEEKTQNIIIDELKETINYKRNIYIDYWIRQNFCYNIKREFLKRNARIEQRNDLYIASNVYIEIYQLPSVLVNIILEY
jgi:superfamily II RNA helicase